MNNRLKEIAGQLKKKLSRNKKETKASFPEKPNLRAQSGIQTEIPQKGNNKKINLPSFTRFSIKDQTLFAKRLAFLTKAGVPLHEGMVILREQCRSRGHGKVFDIIINDIANGKYLHVSLGRFRNFFGGFAINIIRVGEMGGVLTQNLAYLADELRKKQLLKQKIIGALVYPIFISIVTIVLTAMMTVFIFPKVMPIFQSLNVELPLTTIILLGISNFLRDFGLWLVVGIIAFIFLFILTYKKVEPFRKTIDLVTLRIPLIGGIVRSFHLANFNRTTGLLLRSGLSIVDALSITGDTIDNRIYKKACKELADRVRQGERMSKYMKDKRVLFPDMTSHMIAIGEKSGNLSDTLIYLAELYENEVDDKTKNLSNSIEPILMVFMGVLVGFVAVSVIMPIYAITQNLSR